MNARDPKKRVESFSRRLARDESGAALIYVSIALSVFLGFAALVIDGSRLFTLDTELQSAADAIALAGAAELDGNADAETRANRAMDNLVQNSQTFGTGDGAIDPTALTRTFLKELPDDDQPITADHVADTPDEARFVEVKIEGADRRDIANMFATAVGGEDTAPAGATAVAGFTQAVCKFTPLFMCNPFEATDSSLSYFTEQFDSVAEKRRIIALKKTGSTNSVHRAINVRFDLYDSGVPGSWKSSADFRPAKNVTKGYLKSGGGGNGKGNGGGGGGGGNPCNASLDTSSPAKAMGFPIDSSIGANRMGNGDWGVVVGSATATGFEKYWDLNHGNRDGVANDSPPNGWSNSNLPSRYEVYRWEIDNNQIPNKSSVGGENGNTTLAADRCGAAPNEEVDRRIIYAAVLNCTAAGLKGGSGDTIPALTFLKMFITEPMTKLPGTGHTDEDDTLYVEMVDIVKPGVDDEVVHDIVQLYR
ncbi:MAG TPA: pilus assembly protein TadG-related protein [Dongiaceae bacterium]|nr:pilus assembly protein TadG-related protein [Dongiaceae bacterium]